ncbi:MAG: hypothetical protein DWQ06_06820 [Calditrichaeota bacterium]|nr:MAG: hypothetical protein DWQ06_06820 [Calditrichota bacterium]
MLFRVFILTIIFANLAFAKENTTAFLESGVGAKALGMGNSFTGSWENGDNFYWNPAAISFSKRREISAMYASSFLETSYSLLGYTHKLPKDASFGLNWIRYSINDIPINNSLSEETRDPDDPYSEFQTGNNFSSTQQAYFFTFGKKHKFNFDLGWLYFNLPIEAAYGFNVKVIRVGTDKLDAEIFDADQKRDDTVDPAISYTDLSVTGIGMDLGFLIKLNMNEVVSREDLGYLGIGFNIQDLNEEELKWSANVKDKVERAYLTGFHYVQELDWVVDKITGTYTRNSRNGGSNHFGGEFQIKKMFAIRLGSNDGDITYGLGVNFKGFTLDWAFWNHSELEGPHRINLAFQF